LVEPIDTAGICFLVILTVVYLGERASLIDWLGIGVIILGIAFLGFSLVRPTEEFSYRPLVSWFFIILLLGVAVYSFYVAFSRKGEEVSTFLGIGLGVLIGLNAVLIKLAWDDIGNLWHIYQMASLWHSSYAVMAFIGSVGAQVIFQVALQRGRALLLVPLVTGFSNIIPIVVGVLALKEPFPTEFKGIMIRLLSFLMIIGGAILLSLQAEHEESRALSHETG
jgi:drug/metabolite transporter (DMT)-like permease